MRSLRFRDGVVQYCIVTLKFEVAIEISFAEQERKPHGVIRPHRLEGNFHDIEPLGSHLCKKEDSVNLARYVGLPSI